MIGRGHPLSPAKGVLIGLVLGALLWASAIFIATWWVGRDNEPVRPAAPCASPYFGPGINGPIVECPEVTP